MGVESRWCSCFRKGAQERPTEEVTCKLKLGGCQVRSWERNSIVFRAEETAVERAWRILGDYGRPGSMNLGGGRGGGK